MITLEEIFEREELDGQDAALNLIKYNPRGAKKLAQAEDICHDAVVVDITVQVLDEATKRYRRAIKEKTGEAATKAESATFRASNEAWARKFAKDYVSCVSVNVYVRAKVAEMF